MEFEFIDKNLIIDACLVAISQVRADDTLSDEEKNEAERCNKYTIDLIKGIEPVKLIFPEIEDK